MGRINKESILLVVIIALYILASFLVGKYALILENIEFLRSVYGQGSFVALVIAEVVFAPTSIVPLLPVAVKLWGFNMAVALTTFGWTAGSLIAFALARRYGRRVVCYFVEECKIDNWANILPKRALFWYLIFARIFLPIDMISYAVGVFTNMTWPSYIIATIAGSAVSAAIFSFGARLPITWQVIVGLLAIIFVIFYYERFKKNFKKMVNI